MPTDPDCPFCAIVSGHDDSVREVFRTGEVVEFFPKDPATLGHTMIVPVRHVATLMELTNEEAAALGQAAVQLGRWLSQALTPDGLNVIQSNGTAAEQTVGHVHVHVVPRWTADAIGAIWPSETNFSEEAKDKAWVLVTSAVTGEC